MGAGLVTAAFAFVRSHNESARAAGERELESLEVALLAFMGHTAVDEHTEPVFWVKRSEICASLGIRDTEAGRKRVQRALGALAEAGAIALPDKYQRGRTPRYRLIYQGGYPASTPSTEVWTPSIPQMPLKGDAQRPKYGRPASPGMDAQHPPEEGRGRKRREARAIAPAPTLSKFCPRHPTGTDQPCGACREARLEHDKRERSTAAALRPPVRTFRMLDGRNVCDNLPHVPVGGSCMHCEIRPADLADRLSAGELVAS